MRFPALALTILTCVVGPMAPTRSAEPEILSPTRGAILLNGEWQFSSPDAKDLPAMIRVPGSWSANQTSPIASGVTAPALVTGVYRRTVALPAEWAGRRITLDLRRVSTEATVRVNGKDCGRVEWPYGAVDVTTAVRAGANAEIEITVTARTPQGETWALMGYATEEKKKRTLASRGLIGDVILESEPSGTRIADVFVKPSVRKKALELDVEMHSAKPGPWEFTASLRRPNGTEEISFTAKADVAADDLPRISLTFPWDSPRLWGIEKPELYTLWLSAKPAGAAEVADVYPQKFGFREFWIEGKDFFLNGKKVRLRPRGGHWVPSDVSSIRAFIQGVRGAGFNISQIWPEDAMEPGQWNFWELFADESSKAGWLVIGAAPSFKDIALNELNGEPSWTADAQVRTAWIVAMERELKRYRNYPAIVMWSTTANLNNHFADQNPRFLGQKEKTLKHPQWPKTQNVAQEALEEIRNVDPTRPVFMHAAGRIGDIYSVNHYLNILPLQEREEMLSEYMQHGDVPYMGIEFGTPLNTTMNRGRAGFGPSHVSEPFATEYAAIYLGPETYSLEPRAYRRNVRFGYTGKDWQGDWTQLQWLQSSGKPFQLLQSLFIKNTWRSWRASGTTGGMIPWNDLAQIFMIRDKSKRVPAPEVALGQRGPRPAELPAMEASFLKPEGGWVEMESANALREVNAPALAYIGGPVGTNEDPVAFTAKDHNFRVGQKIEKSAILINDSGETQLYRIAWTANLEGREIGSGKFEGSIEQAQNIFLPLTFSIPSLTDGARTNGEIRLQAQVGESTYEDTFKFRAFGNAAIKPFGPVLIFDPEGKTSAMLAKFSVPTVPWKGRPSRELLIIGREALSKRHKLPGPLAGYVKAGGRVLIFSQSPEFLRDSMGFRVADAVSRRVFPIDPSHPALGGLDADDLRDWTSQGTLLDPKPEYPANVYPPHGWRWGTRGSVASAMLEKPHRSGWRPLLEGEFDLAYSPLLELDAGKGLAILCTLDLEDATDDPAAERLARSILAYAATAKPVAPRNTVFLGTDEDFNFLTKNLGVISDKATSLMGAALAIVAPGAAVTTEQIVAFAETGGQVVMLAQKEVGVPGLAGGNLIPAKSFAGARANLSSSPATVGLSASDTRFRSDIDWIVFDKSPDTFAQGLLHVRDVGHGRIVQAQFDPRWFETGKMPMFRLTRWRHTRALSQILANAGARFQADTRTLEPRTRRLSLAGPWKVKITSALPLTPWDKPHADPGISKEAAAAVAPDLEDSSWETFELPAMLPAFESQSGEAVWRKTIEIPQEWSGQILQLGAGRIKTYDSTFFDGQQVGSTGPAVKDAWNLPRRYRIPGHLVRGGKVVIAIREFVTDYQGGIHGRADELYLRPVVGEAKSENLYDADYKEEFDFGDDPYRYYRW